MTNPTAKFLTSSALLTIGVVLMMLNVSWLTFLGLALVFFAGYYSPQGQVSQKAILLCLVGAVFSLLAGGNPLVPEPYEAWRPLYLLMLCGVWVWGLASEYRAWRAGKQSGK